MESMIIAIQTGTFEDWSDCRHPLKMMKTMMIPVAEDAATAVCFGGGGCKLRNDA